MVGLLLRSQKSGSCKKVLQAITAFIAELRFVLKLSLGQSLTTLTFSSIINHNG